MGELAGVWGRWVLEHRETSPRARKVLGGEGTGGADGDRRLGWHRMGLGRPGTWLGQTSHAGSPIHGPVRRGLLLGSAKPLCPPGAGRLGAGGNYPQLWGGRSISLQLPRGWNGESPGHVPPVGLDAALMSTRLWGGRSPSPQPPHPGDRSCAGWSGIDPAHPEVPGGDVPALGASPILHLAWREEKWGNGDKDELRCALPPLGTFGTAAAPGVHGGVCVCVCQRWHPQLTSPMGAGGLGCPRGCGSGVQDAAGGPKSSCEP